MIHKSCRTGCRHCLRLGWLSVLAAASLGAASGADRARPLEFDDLLGIQRLSDPQVSPDGHSIAYVVTRADKAENRTDSDIWLAPLAAGRPRELTASPNDDRHPRRCPAGKWTALEPDQGRSIHT